MQYAVSHLGALALLVLAAGSASATALSHSHLNLDLGSFSITASTGYAVSGYSAGGNANAQSDPLAPDNPAVFVGPFFATSDWALVDPAVSNAAITASSAGRIDGAAMFTQAYAGADGIHSQTASAAAVLYENVEFTVSQAGTFTFSIPYLINQTLSRDTVDETASANSQVSFEIRRSGGNPYSSEVLHAEPIRVEVFNRLVDEQFTGGVAALSGILSHSIALDALQPGEFYSIGIQAYTQAYADTPTFSPVPAASTLPLLALGLCMLGLQRNRRMA